MRPTETTPTEPPSVLGTLYSPTYEARTSPLPCTNCPETGFWSSASRFLQKFTGLRVAWDLGSPKFVLPEGEEARWWEQEKGLLGRIRSWWSLSSRLIVSPYREKSPISLGGLRREEVLYLLYSHFVLGNLLVGGDHAVSLRRVRGWDGRWRTLYGTGVIAFDVDIPLEKCRDDVSGFLREVRVRVGLKGLFSMSHSRRVHVYFLFRGRLLLSRAFELGKAIEGAFYDFLPQARGRIALHPSNPDRPGKALFLPLGFLSDGEESVDIGYPTPLSSLVSFLGERVNEVPGAWVGWGSRRARRRGVGLVSGGSGSSSAGSSSVDGGGVSAVDSGVVPAGSEDLDGSSEEKRGSSGSGVISLGNEGSSRVDGGADILVPKVGRGWVSWGPYSQGANVNIFRSAVREVSTFYVRGQRQNLVLGLAGLGVRLGLGEEEVLRELEPLLSGDEERSKRLEGVRRTFQRAEGGQSVAWRPWLAVSPHVDLPNRLVVFLDVNFDLLDQKAGELKMSPKVLRLVVIIAAEVVSKSLLGRSWLGYDALAKRWKASKRDISAAFRILLGKGILERVEKGFCTPLPGGRKLRFPSGYRLLREELLLVMGEEEFFGEVVKLLRRG